MTKTELPELPEELPDALTLYGLMVLSQPQLIYVSSDTLRHVIGNLCYPEDVSVGTAHAIVCPDGSQLRLIRNCVDWSVEAVLQPADAPDDAPGETPPRAAAQTPDSVAPNV